MVDWLVDMWEDISIKQVWKNWSPGGIVQGVLYEKGLFDNSPLVAFLTEHLN